MTCFAWKACAHERWALKKKNTRRQKQSQDPDIPVLHVQCSADGVEHTQSHCTEHKNGAVASLTFEQVCENFVPVRLSCYTQSRFPCCLHWRSTSTSQEVHSRSGCCSFTLSLSFPKKSEKRYFCNHLYYVAENIACLPSHDIGCVMNFKILRLLPNNLISPIMPFEPCNNDHLKTEALLSLVCSHHQPPLCAHFGI